MTRVVERERIHIKGSSADEIIAEMEDIAGRAFEQAEIMNQNFGRLTEEAANPERIIGQLARSRHFPRRSQDEMLRRAGGLDSEHQTMYDALNVVTEVARDTTNPHHQLLFQDAAAHVTEDIHCASCGSEIH
jgi:hypothetical protein